MLAGNDANHFFVTAPTTGTPKPTRVWVLGDAGTAIPIAGRRARRLLHLHRQPPHRPLAHAGRQRLRQRHRRRDAGRSCSTFTRPCCASRCSGPRGAITSRRAAAAPALALPQPTPCRPTARRAASPRAPRPTTPSTTATSTSSAWTPSAPAARRTGRWPPGCATTWPPTSRPGPSPTGTTRPIPRGRTTRTPRPSSWRCAQNLNPILEEGGVDLVLNGHSHAYERSYLLDGHYGTSATFDPDDHVVIPGRRARGGRRRLPQGADHAALARGRGLRRGGQLRPDRRRGPGSRRHVHLAR